MASAPPLRRTTSGQVPSLREHALVPVGMATILPEAARQVRHLEAELLTCCNRFGYDEIILPTFEYLDVLAPGLEPTLLENSYKIVDRTTGRILLLRPDVTAQIARTVAMGMVGAQFPLRLSYRATVFRYEPEHAGRGREIFQVGAELIGADDPSADCEIIMLLIECLRQIGLHSFKISLGHVGFFKALLVRAGLSTDGRKRAEEAAARKDLPRLEEILSRERVTKWSVHGILNALELCGQADVLSKGRVLAKGEPALVQALDRLENVYRLLCTAGSQDVVMLDLGEFRGFDYYDGIVFDVFTDGIGVELGGGGRYDHLIGRFGRNLASTGFALNVDRLFRGLEPHGSVKSVGPEVLVVGPPECSTTLVLVAQELRKAGIRTVQQTVDSTGRSLIGTAVKVGRASAIDTIVVVGVDNPKPDHAMLLHLDGPRQGAESIGRPRIHKKTLPIPALVASLRADREGVL